MRTGKILVSVFFVIFSGAIVCAQDAVTIPKFNFVEKAETPAEISTTLEILFLFTVLAVAPTILVMTTSFARIAIVLSFLRRALATQTTPPDHILNAMALLLTFMIMSPTWSRVYSQALGPYFDNEISQKQAFEKGIQPIREFMFKQVRKKDVKLFLDISKTTGVKKKEDIPTLVLIPAFTVSELSKAFIMGFLLYLPFFIIDMVVASVLMSMGMMMLPPILVSLPFKILMFVLVDGWNLVIGEVVRSFY